MQVTEQELLRKARENWIKINNKEIDKKLFNSIVKEFFQAIKDEMAKPTTTELSIIKFGQWRKTLRKGYSVKKFGEKEKNMVIKPTNTLYFKPFIDLKKQLNHDR